MSVTVRLVHTTGYTYNGHASASYNEARLTPLATADQTILHSRLEVSPSPWSLTWTDYWGTQVTTFEVHEPHDELLVTGISTVVVGRTPATGHGLTWEQLAAPAVRDELDELLTVGERVAPGDELGRIAAELREHCTGPAEFVQRVCERIRSRVRRLPGRTAGRGPARDAWAASAGTCQDLAHLAIGVLRSQGVPARYVRGYLLADHDAQQGASMAGQTHAWLQWWDGAWLGLDPASCRVPDDFYIEVARGRDDADVVPLRGIFTGSPGSTMFMTVEASRLA